ncbi:MAG: YhbY family RNA-binding protein [Halioglobus sp.]
MSNNSALNVKQLRAIGHKLKPIVTIAGNGLSETVLAELHRALKDHELIKIKLAVGSREARAETIQKACEQTGATLVQSIGNTALLVLRSKKPDPKLSNLIKPVSASNA